MANELLDKPVEFEVNGNDVKLTGNTVAKYLTRGNGNVSEQEVVMFINLCKFQKLNPFLNEAYLIKFGNQPAQIIVSKEAFMKRAESHPQYDGMEAGIIVERGDEMIEIEGAVKLKGDVLIGGWSKIYRKDRTRPVIVKVDLKEFSKGQATWKDMPLNMIRKTAIVNALREAFPDNVGAMYTEEEAPPVPKEAKATEEIIQKEIEENANQEVISFSNQGAQKRNAPRKEAEPVAVDPEPSEKEEIQEALFDELNPPVDANPGF